MECPLTNCITESLWLGVPVTGSSSGPARRFRQTWHAGRPLERQIAETALVGETAPQQISELQAQGEGTNGH